MGCTDYNYSEKEKCDHANDQIVTHVLATIMIFNRTFKVCMFYKLILNDNSSFSEIRKYAGACALIYLMDSFIVFMFV